MTKAALEVSIGHFETLIQVFAVLVAIGIVGEVGFGIRLWILNKRLHAIQHAEDLNQEQAIAGLNKEAGEARKDAADALERAAKAEENLGETKKSAAEANERASKAQEQAAKSNEIAERERLERLQLEAKLAPRVLDATQTMSLTAKLGTIGHKDIDVLVYGDTPEIVRLSSSIMSIFQHAGWHARVWVVVSGGMAVSGILVSTGPDADGLTTVAADSLVEALKKVRLDTIRWQPFDPHNLPGMLNGPAWDAAKLAPIRMLIGAKP